MSSTPSKQHSTLTSHNQRAPLPSPQNPTSASSSPSVSPAASTTLQTPTGASEAVSRPLLMNEIPHDEFTPIYIHTAKCDRCEERNRSVLQRCTTCSIHLCQRCMRGGDGKHKPNDKLDWTDYGAQANSQPRKKEGMGPKPPMRTSALEASELQAQNEKATFERNEAVRRAVANLALPRTIRRRETVRAETSGSEDMNVQEDNLTAASRRIPSHQQLTERSLLIGNEIEGESPGEGSALGKRSHGNDHEDNNGAEVTQASKKGKLTQTSAAPANKENAVLQLRVNRPVANGESSEAAAQQTRQGQDQLIMIFNMRTRRALSLGTQMPTGSSSITDAAVSAEVNNLCNEIAQLDSRRGAISRQITVLEGEAQNINGRVDQRVANLQGQAQTFNVRNSQQIAGLQGEAQTFNVRIGQQITGLRQQIAGLQGEVQTSNARIGQQIAGLEGEAQTFNARNRQEITVLQSNVQTYIARRNQEVAVLQDKLRNINATIAENARYIDEALARKEL